MCKSAIIIDWYNGIHDSSKDLVEIATNWFKAFPNKDNVYVEGISKINNSLYCVKWYVTAKHEGMFWDLSATGATVDYKGACFLKIQNDLIITYQTESNTRINLITSGSLPIIVNVA